MIIARPSGRDAQTDMHERPFSRAFRLTRSICAQQDERESAPFWKSWAWQAASNLLLSVAATIDFNESFVDFIAVHALVRSSVL